MTDTRLPIQGPARQSLLRRKAHPLRPSEALSQASISPEREEFSALRGDREDRLAEMIERYLGKDIMDGFEADDVTEIYVNPQDGVIRFDTRSRGKASGGSTIDLNRVEQFLNAVADLHGVVLSATHPQLQAELPARRFKGARLQGFLPPVTRGPSFVVRKPPVYLYPLESYVDAGSLTPAGLRILEAAIEEHLNILIVGGTGSGKTTLANALLKAITDCYPAERIVILEDTVELQCAATDHLALRTTADMSLAALVRHTLRAFPDRIVVGEVRGPEALDLLDAWSTGHPGGLGTFHGQDATGALQRLNRLCQRAGVPSQIELIAEAIDLIVLIEGTPVRRCIRGIIRVHGLNREGHFEVEPLVPGEKTPEEDLFKEKPPEEKTLGP